MVGGRTMPDKLGCKREGGMFNEKKSRIAGGSGRAGGGGRESKGKVVRASIGALNYSRQIMKVLVNRIRVNILNLSQSH